MEFPEGHDDMAVDPQLVDDIYEAAVATDRWPDLLERIADRAGSIGAVLNIRSAETVHLIAAPRVRAAVEDFIAEGWAGDSYPEPLLRDQYPGFRCPTHYRSIAEIEAMLIHRDFFRPRGMIGAAGTAIQGSGNDLLHVALDGFPSFAAAEAALPFLDTLRPHLARAMSLTSLLLLQRAQLTVEALAFAGIAAAIVSREGRLKAANTPFEMRLADRCDRSRHRLRFTDAFLDRQFTAGLARSDDANLLRSIATRAGPDAIPLVIHMLPLRGAARAVADSDGVLLIVADGSNALLPGADLLRILFDLTPAEARVARMVAEGATPAAAATQLGISINTVRVHLRAIFAKTGTARQADLAALFGRLGSGQSSELSSA